MNVTKLSSALALVGLLIGLLKLVYPTQARRLLERAEVKLLFPAAITWVLTLRQYKPTSESPTLRSLCRQ
jgi:uncharacterized protein YjeT (DUF2065 family)